MVKGKRLSSRMTIRLLRATLVALAASLLSTCSDAPNTAGRPRVASLAVSPVLVAGQSSAGLVLDQVKLVVKRPGAGKALLDKQYVFPATQNVLTISDSVEIDGESERLEVTLSLFSGTTALFSGSTTREVRASGGETFEVELHYVGPGSEITTLALVPRDTQLTFGDALEFRVTATDAQQRPVTQYYLTWSSNNAAQAPNASGVLRAGNARSVLQITARTPGGVQGATSVTIVPPPTQVVKIAGDNQNALVSTQLPQALEVEVRGADGLAVPGVRVDFAPSGPGGGSVENALVITDQNGRARTRATLGATAGRQDFNATVAGAGTATFSATATPIVPAVSFASASQTVSEGVGTATIAVQLSAATSVPVTVPFTLSGTAASPADYTITASPLVIPAGSTSGSVTVTVVSDAVAEPDESVIVTLGTPTNGTLGSATVHTLTIAGQAPPTVSWTQASQTASEGATATVTAQLSGPSSQAVTVPFTLGGTATSGADFTIPTATPLTIPAGSASVSITVNIASDGTAEPNETVVVTMGTPTNATPGATTVHTITISGQQPTVNWSASSQTVGESAGLVSVTAVLSSPSTQVISIPYTASGTATNGSDYAIAAGPLVIQPGNTSGSFNVNVVNDSSAEATETVVLTMGTPTNAIPGATTQHTIFIQDNDASLSILFTGRGQGTVTSQSATPAISCSTTPPPSQCSGTYVLGSSVTLLATPQFTSEGIFHFENWIGTGTGFTCTTNPTCVVPMTQSRQVTAHFSTIGQLSLNPSTATFNMQEAGTPPAALAISVTNIGERPVVLNSTIPISYQQTVPPWLSAQINKLTVDTLSPATLTVSVLPTTLAPGTYTATVTLRDSGLQFSWSLSVTLIVVPPASGPSISNIRVTLIQLNDAQRCTLGTPVASSFRVEFDYNDPNGDGPLSISQAGLNISWLFTPLNDTGSFTNYTYMSSLTGNGSTGHAITTQCWRWGSNTLLTATMSIVDQGGLRGPNAQYTLQKPAGAN